MRRAGFTLIELVMVILLLSVLAATAIPNFIDFRKDAKNASAKGSLGALRSALSITRAAIALKEDTTTPKYPTLTEMRANTFSGSHPNLSGVNIMEPSSGIPKNPWTVSTRATQFHNSILDGSGFGNTKADYFTGGTSETIQYGWVYHQTSGEIWAASQMNGGSTVNWYCDTREMVTPVRTTEDCY